MTDEPDVYVFVYFQDGAGSRRDVAAQHIFRDHGATIVGAGTLMFGPAAGTRDLQADVPGAQLQACLAALKAAGFYEVAVSEK